MGIKFKVWCLDYNEWEKDEVFLSQSGIQYHSRRLFPVKYDRHIVMQSAGLTDKNGNEIYYNGQLLRIKGIMGDKGEYSYDCIYKTNEMSFEGLSLSFVKLYDETLDSKLNSFPISQRPSFLNGALGWSGEHRLIINDTYGENTLLRHTWKEHHKTEDIEVIGNIYKSKELLENN